MKHQFNIMGTFLNFRSLREKTIHVGSAKMKRPIHNSQYWRKETRTKSPMNFPHVDLRGIKYLLVSEQPII
jgi:hypothetical protein